MRSNFPHLLLLRRTGCFAQRTAGLFIPKPLAGDVVFQIAFSLLANFFLQDLRSLSTEYPLNPLPRLRTQKEQGRSDKHNPPLPRNPRVTENFVVDYRNVYQGENSKEPNNIGPEQELVLPDIPYPLCPAMSRGGGPHVEEGPAHVNHFPGEEEHEPCETGKSCTACSEHHFATFIVIIAVGAQVAVAKSKYYQ